MSQIASSSPDVPPPRAATTVEPIHNGDMAKTKKKTTTTSNNKRRRPGDPEISGCDDATLCPKKKTPRKKLSGGREDRTTLPSASFQAADNGKHDPNSSAVVRTLQCLDPILQWLTKRSGQPVIAAPVLYRALPPAVFGGLVPGGTDRSTNNQEDGEDSTEHHQQPENTAAGANAGHNNSALVLLDHIRILCRCNVLHCAEMPPDAALSSSSYLDTYNSTTTRSRTSQVATTTTSNSPTTINASGVGGVRSWDDATWGIGFPLPTTTASSSAEPSLHGSTRAAAKRRLACLWRHLLLQQPEKVPPLDSSKSCDGDSAAAASDGPTKTVAPTRTAPWDAKIEQHDSSTSATMDSSMSPMVKNNCHSDNGVPPQESHRQELQQQPGSPCHSPDNNDDIDLGAQFLDEREGRQALQSVFGFSVEGTPTTTSAEDTECRGSSECMSDSTVTGNQRTGFSTTAESTILPLQASYAGSVAAQAPVYAELSDSAKRQVPWQLLHAIGIYDEGERMDSNKCQGRHETTNETAFPSTNDDWKEKSSGGNNSVPLPARKRLFSHQVAAIEAALAGIHCSICTGTGSGKSLCFLLPALTAAYRYDRRSLILFPTKALAQDQLSKLQSLLAQAAAVRRRRGRGSDGNNCVDEDNDWTERIRPATLDGDTSHADRGRIGSSANIILTNPDTLHAAILPGWRTSAYRPILEALQYVIIDEAHSYHGIFGSHVALVLRRLVRVCAFASMDSDSVETDRNVGVTFISASATLPWPKEHFRRLCPVGEVTPVKILTSNEDGSPRSAKHFFVWNPPVLHPDGKPTDQVTFPQIEKSTDLLNELEKRHSGASTSLDPKPDQIYKNSDDVEETDDSGPLSPLTLSTFSTLIKEENYDIPLQEPSKLDRPYKIEYYRRHAADETARLLAKAIVNDIRCIAFCRSRNLVEWVYSKALEILQSDPSSAKLSSRLESYRGGYSLQERRKIEERLFNYQVLGVVGTNALELGVDIGGIELTLHCGYPSSYASLLQQAGRAGRCKDCIDIPSLSVVVCFNSPSEQQIWRHPSTLFGQGVSVSNSIPLCSDIVQGHLLCASDELPLCGHFPVSVLKGRVANTGRNEDVLPDREMFGSNEYDDALVALISTGALIEETVSVSSLSTETVQLFKARASLRKAWSRLSIRSIEPIQYSIVDLSHRDQRGRTDSIVSSAAVLDTLPYSCVFYHAHPGAIVTHRAKKYEIVSMTTPPAFVGENFGCVRGLTLAAFVRPTKARYFTRPLSKTTITIVKQMEMVQLVERRDESNNGVELAVTLAGCGAVNLKRQVRGYKKLSGVNFQTISKTELSLPPIEYDTFGLYICTDSTSLSNVLGDKYGPGVHALSHALLAVAPMFAEGLTRGDLECDHSFFAPTRLVLFDQRAGGSGCSQRLWKHFFQPNNILQAALELLKECTMCRMDSRYDGGCPACLHTSNCSKFNMYMSRSAAIAIGERMLERIKLTEVYQKHAKTEFNESNGKKVEPIQTTPRRKARIQALKQAKEMHSARNRQFVVGRPAWPLDCAEKGQVFG